MLIWQWGLIASSTFLFVVFIFVLLRYFSLKKKVSKPDVTDETKSVALRDGKQDVSVAEKRQWLALLEQQRNICAQLLTELPKSDFQGRAALSCWAIFLDVEIHIIENSVPNQKVLSLLDGFKSLLDKVDRAQEIDALWKS